jgi:hypothetical protein
MYSRDSFGAVVREGTFCSSPINEDAPNLSSRNRRRQKTSVFVLAALRRNDTGNLRGAASSHSPALFHGEMESCGIALSRAQPRRREARANSPNPR